MNIQAINAYMNPNVNNIKESMNVSPEIGIKDRTTTDKTYEEQDINLKSPDKIVTDKERQFFINLFPESSEQIENHILFNRNGRLQTPNISIGTIVDGRI